MSKSDQLFRYVRENATTKVLMLLDQGCDVDARGELEGTALHIAAAYGHEGIARLLIDRGSDINARNRHQRTPLHSAAKNGEVKVMELLLDRGCAVDELAELDRTPLYYAAENMYFGATRLLLDRGAKVDATDKHGATPLHVASEKGAVSVVRLLLDREVRVVTAGHSMFRTDEKGNTPLTYAVFEMNIESANLLLKRMTNSAKTEPTPWGNEIAVAVSDGWRDQHTRGEPLAIVPEEVLDAGAQDVRSFFKFLQHPGATYRTKLCVIGPSCWGKTSLIKTLTTEKATRERADKRTIGIDRFSWTFESPTTESTPARWYVASVLDFAGQEEYQSAHTIFYSKRTLYVACVNIKAYNDRLKLHKILTCGQADGAMDAFFDETIYSRIRAVCAREPESEFAFVGTKLDLVRHSDECVQRVGDDVLARFRRRDADEVRALDRTLEALKHSETATDGIMSAAVQVKVTRLESLRHQRPKVLTQKFVAMSSANAKGLSTVRKELQDCIISGGSAFLMPADYTNVKDYLREIVREAKQTESLTAQINAIFMHPDELVKRILADPQFATLETNDVTSILHVLHALGDILWFDKSSGALSDVVFLSPDLVIDFVRKMINHELGERRPGCFMWLGSPRGLSVIEKAVKKEGRVAHKLLTSLALWRDVTDDKLMLQLKELLFHFQLAYPAGAKRLQFDSDLIVPVYWKKNGTAQSIPNPPSAMTAVATWDYDFQNGLPQSLFDRLGVTSYSAIYSKERFFSRDSFGTQSDVYWAKVAKHSEDDDDDTIGSSTLRLQVAATASTIAWQQLAWYVISVERVLDEYPGLWVVRYAVSKDGLRHELDQLLEERESLVNVGTVASDSSACGLVPPSMDWFTHREWQIVGHKKSLNSTSSAPTESSSSESSLNVYEKLIERVERDIHTHLDDIKHGVRTQLDAVNESVHKHLDEVQETSITLSAAEGNRRDYPALWTLAYREEAATSIYELEMRSELSGKCYHDPIRITVPNGFFSKYDVVIKTGLSVLCAVIPDMLGKGAVECLASAAGDQIDRSVAVHSLVDGLDLGVDQCIAMEKNRALPPDATVALLRDLLTMVDDAFDPLKMSTISGLECGIHRKTGEHLWAHRLEIEAQRDTIRFRHEYHASVTSEDAVVLQVVETIPDNAAAGAGDHEVLCTESAAIVSTVSEVVTCNDVSSAEKTMQVRDGEATVLRSLDTIQKAAPVPSSSFDLMVEIVKATKLPNVRLVGTQSPFCQWRILDASGESIASGQTHAHVRGGSNPDWSGQLVRVSAFAKTLKGCVLVVAVKTETAIGAITEVIAEGTYPFSDDVVSTGKPCEFSLVLTSKGEPAGALTVRLQR